RVDTSGGAPTLTLNNNATATYDAAGSDPTHGTLLFDYVVGAGDQTSNLEITSVNPHGAVITDRAGFNPDFSFALNSPTYLRIGAGVSTNTPPSLSALQPIVHVDENGGTVALSPSVTVTDPDSVTLAGATISVTGGPFAGDGDVLAATTAGTSITASYN